MAAKKDDKPKKKGAQRISLTIAIPVGIIGGNAAGPAVESIMAGDMSNLTQDIQDGMAAAVQAVPTAMTAGIMLGILKLFVGGGSIPIGKNYRVGL